MTTSNLIELLILLVVVVWGTFKMIRSHRQVADLDGFCGVSKNSDCRGTVISKN